MKRMLCLFLSLILAVGICFSAPVTITASAGFTLESGYENTVGAVYNDSESRLKFRILDLENKYVEVCGYNTAPTNLGIPATVTINETTYSVTTIGMGAFDNCNKLTTITIPQSVTSIGSRAFVNCESLTSVVIPDSVVSLGEMAFYTCGGLETVTLSNNITVIPDDAFAYCHSLKTLPITENITSIGECAFYDSGEHSKVSLSGVTIGSEAFWDCGITELTLENCKLNDVNIFINNDIEELVLSNTDIPDRMFDGHAYIKTLVAEDSALGSSSFANCSELKSVTVSGGEINNDAFRNCSLLETGTIDNIDFVGEYAFNNCINLKTIEVNATEISEYAFSMCTSLENVKLSDGVEVIGDAVFEGCASLAELELPETVTKIGERVFNGCNLLTELVIPESVTDVSAEAFAGCFNLKYVFFVGDEEDIGNKYIANAKIHYGSSTHTFNENYTVDIDPTCTEKGSESQHCKYCEVTQNERPVKENGHIEIKGGTEAVHTKCDICEEILSTEHEFTSKITTAPTCTKEGVKTFTCECGYTYTAVVPATGHKEVVIPAVAPTYITVGKTEGKKCSVCGTVTVAQKDVAKLTLATPVVTVKNSATGVKVTWKAVDGAENYKVYRKTYSTKTKKYGSWKTCGTVTTTSYVDTKAKSGTKYIYTVKALNSDAKSAYKSSSSILFLSQPTVKIANASTGVKVSWNKTTGATGYKIYRAEYVNGKWTGWKSVKTIDKGSTVSWTDKSAKCGVKYKYTVKAVNGKTASNYKSSSSLLYLAQPTVTVKAVSNGVKVDWTQSTGATSYKIYRSEYNTKTKKWSSWKGLKTAKSTSKSYTDKSAKKGVKYRYTVKAVNGKTASTYKASSSVKR